jgi:predicted Fe-Mo cluster-binding NifX family protein
LFLTLNKFLEKYQSVLRIAGFLIKLARKVLQREVEVLSGDYLDKTRERQTRNMKIAVTTQGNDLSAQIDSRFGRAPKFLVVDTETMRFDVAANTQSLDLAQGAGIQSAQNVLVHKPDVVLTGNCGPKAFRVLKAAGVKVVVGVKGKIDNAIRNYLNGKYGEAAEANVEGHWV